MPAAQKHMPKTDSDLNQVYIKRLALVDNERQPYIFLYMLLLVLSLFGDDFLFTVYRVKETAY